MGGSKWAKTERGVMLLLPVIEKETLIIVLCSLAACLRKKYVHGDERLAGCVFASRPNFSSVSIGGGFANERGRVMRSFAAATFSSTLTSKPVKRVRKDATTVGLKRLYEPFTMTSADR